MKKFWYNLNRGFFKFSLVSSIVLAVLLSVLCFYIAWDFGVGWLILIGFIVLIFGVFYAIVIHSLWGLSLEFINSVYEIREDLKITKNEISQIKKISKNNETNQNELLSEDDTDIKQYWECPKCGKSNPDSMNYCVVCGTHKNVKSEKSLSSWVCSNCNSLNPISEKQCSNCNQPKPTSTWKCLKCHTVNPDIADTCRVCNRPR